MLVFSNASLDVYLNLILNLTNKRLRVAYDKEILIERSVGLTAFNTFL